MFRLLLLNVRVGAEFGRARLGSGFGSVPGLEFFWLRLDSVLSVDLIEVGGSRLHTLLCMESGYQAYGQPLEPDGAQRKLMPSRETNTFAFAKLG
jgi:hypothetical protein